MFNVQLSLLEHDLQRELDLSRGRGRLFNHARRWADSSARKNDLVRGREIGVIENIEGLRTELQIQFLVDGELLEQRCVEVDQLRTSQRSAAVVAIVIASATPSCFAICAIRAVR